MLRARYCLVFLLQYAIVKMTFCSPLYAYVLETETTLHRTVVYLLALYQSTAGFTLVIVIQDAAHFLTSLGQPIAVLDSTAIPSKCAI